MNPVELTDNVIFLRPFTLADAAAHLAGEDEEQIKWLSGGESTIEGIKRWIVKNHQHWVNDGPLYNFAIVNNEGKLVGMVEANTNYQELEGLEDGDANISYGIYPTERGNGYATRAVKLMLSFLKTKGVHRAVIRVNPKNTDSLKVPIRCGFTEDGKVLTNTNEKLIKFTKPLL